MNIFSKIMNAIRSSKSIEGVSQQNVSNDNSLKYTHNEMQLFIYNSYTDKSTGIRWLSKYNYSDVEVERQAPYFTELFEYDVVDITPDTDRENSVAVKFHENLIGYLKSEKLSCMALDFIHRGDQVKAQIQKIDGDTIYLRMFYCKKREDVIQKVSPFVVKLIGNGSDDMQSDISCCSAGDKVYAEMDYDKDKFLVCSGTYEIGYVPKSKEEYMFELENNNYEFSGEIIEIGENESNGKYYVKVKIQPE